MAAVMKHPKFLNSIEVARLAGVSYRQLDYLVREGVVEPRGHDGGTGNPRCWAPEQLPVLRFAAILREHGARKETIGPAVVELESMHDRAWGARVLVSLDGGIHTLLGDEANGWVVDLAHCRDLLPVAESALTAA